MNNLILSSFDEANFRDIIGEEVRKVLKQYFQEKLQSDSPIEDRIMNSIEIGRASCRERV